MLIFEGGGGGGGHAPSVVFVKAKSAGVQGWISYTETHVLMFVPNLVLIKP